MACLDNITADYLRSILSYDQSTGIFRWLVRPRVGSQAGCLNTSGRRQIGINGRYYLASRLAWLYMTGEWPIAHIDHIDCDKDNNEFLNLREASHAENSRNRGKNRNNKSGFKGVSWNNRLEKWIAQITVDGTKIHLGVCSTPQEAANIYAVAASKYHTNFARTS